MDLTPYDFEDTLNYCGSGVPTEGPGNQHFGASLSSHCICDTPDAGEYSCALYYDSLEGCLDAPPVFGCTDPHNPGWCQDCYIINNDGDYELGDCNTMCQDAGYEGCEEPVPADDELGCPNQLDDTLCWSVGCVSKCGCRLVRSLFDGTTVVY